MCKTGNRCDHQLRPAHSGHPHPQIFRQGHVHRVVHPPVRPTGLPVPGRGPVPAPGLLHLLLPPLLRAQGLVLLRAVHALRLPPHLRLHHDDAAALHQLQAQERGAPALANVDLQGTQHLH